MTAKSQGLDTMPQLQRQAPLSDKDAAALYEAYLREQERRPSSGDFKPGEFTKLFQKTLETVDLIFQDGIDWDAFADLFKKVEGKNKGAQLDVQSIEKKEGSVLVVRVNVSPDTDKAKIHSDFMQGYEFACKALEAQYQARLEDKDKQINQLFYLLNQSNEKLGEVPKLMTENPKYDLRGSKFGGGFAAEGGTQIGGTLIDYSSSQSVSEAAEKIQQCLIQLQTQGYSLENAQQEVARDLATQAQSNHTFKSKLASWGQYLSDAITNGVIAEVAVEVIKLALNSAGISLP